MDNRIKVYCANCKFFDDRLQKPNFGICRRYAPRPFNKQDKMDTSFSSFPFVDLDAWCGEFEPNLALMMPFDPEIEEQPV